MTSIQACRGQLAPFEGLWGYNLDLDYYPGTIFRFPLRTAEHISNSDFDRKIYSIDDTEKMLSEYFHEARISLLFLRRISSFNFESSKGLGWSLEIPTRITSLFREQSLANSQHLLMARESLERRNGGLQLSIYSWMPDTCRIPPEEFRRTLSVELPPSYLPISIQHKL